MQSHPENKPTAEDEYNTGALWMMAAVPAMMSQPQSREESVPNNFSKIGPSCHFKIDPLPLVSAIFCLAAAFQPPRLPVSHQCLWGQPRGPVESLSMKHIAKNKVNFPFKPRQVINPRTPLPSTPCCSLLPHTLLPSPAHVPCAGKLVTWGKKKRRLSHEVIALSHFYSSAFSRCLQLSLLYSCTWLLRLWSSPLLHVLWCILAYIVCNLTPCHLIPPNSHNPYQPLSPRFHLSFV